VAANAAAMRHKLPFGMVLLAGLAVSAFAQMQMAPLVMFKREAIEGMIWDTNVVHLGNQTFNGSLQGIGSPGTGGIQYALDGEWDVLEAHIGYPKGTTPKRMCKFIVETEKGNVFESGEVKGGQEPEFIRVPMEGVKSLILRIQPISYGGTLGAAYAAPQLKRGLPPELKVTPYVIEINGTRVPFDQSTAPQVVPVSLPVKAGESVYQVRVFHDSEKRRIEVKTTP
jgi:hypothetical protein